MISADYITQKWARGWFPLLRAIARGKQLQRVNEGGVWFDDFPTSTNGDYSEWRVKPATQIRETEHD